MPAVDIIVEVIGTREVRIPVVDGPGVVDGPFALRAVLIAFNSGLTPPPQSFRKSSIPQIKYKILNGSKFVF